MEPSVASDIYDFWDGPPAVRHHRRPRRLSRNTVAPVAGLSSDSESGSDGSVSSVKSHLGDGEIGVEPLPEVLEDLDFGEERGVLPPSDSDEEGEPPPPKMKAAKPRTPVPKAAVPKAAPPPPAPPPPAPPAEPAHRPSIVKRGNFPSFSIRLAMAFSEDHGREAASLKIFELTAGTMKVAP